MCVKKWHILLLLTACVDPSRTNNLEWHTLKDVDTRLNHYIDALDFFYRNTDLKILFVENSGYDISKIETVNRMKSTGRLEIHSYVASEDVRQRGKGPGEVDIIKHAIENSAFMKDADYVIKVTGRVKILNIQELIRLIYKIERKHEYVIGEKLFKAHWIQSYLFIAHKNFFNKSFFEQLNRINENESALVTFEDCLYNAVKNWVSEGGRYHNVIRPIQVEGIKGNGDKYFPGTVRLGKTKCLLNAIMCNVFRHI